MTATRIGDGGGSNFTFLIERGGERFVLRRPPRPPLPPSAHDMVREARLQQAIRAAGFTRLAEIVAVCDDDTVIGVPFYVMRHLDGHVITQELPPGLETADARHALGLDLVDTLAEIHAADVSTPRSRRSNAPAATSNARSAASPTSGRSTRRASSPTSTRSRASSPSRSPSRSRRPSSTATTASGT